MMGVAWAPAAPAAILPARSEIFRLLREKRFDELEELTGELRREKLEFYKGRSKLSRFYGFLEISREIDDHDWMKHIEMLEGWAKAEPGSATPLIVLGDAYISYGWKARGSGYADTVTEEGWRLFRERLATARTNLEAAERLPDKDPEVYRALMVVALGQGWSRSEMEYVFEQGVKLEPNYLQLYEAKAYHLLPRWFGQRGDWEKFAQEAAGARGGEEGEILYMVIARSQAWSEGEQFFSNTEIAYSRMKRGFEAAIKRNPESLYDINSYCYFACIAGDRETAVNLFQKINGRWESGVWRQESRFQQWQNWALRQGDMPVESFRSRSVARPFLLEHIKSLLTVAGAAWLAVVAVIVWAAVHNYRKSP